MLVMNRFISKLMEFEHLLPKQLPLHPITGTKEEYLKRQPIVLEQVSEIMMGSENFRKFSHTFDSTDAKNRVDLVDVLAQKLKIMGTLVRVMYHMEELAKAPMDPCVCCERFVEEVKFIVGSKNVRLFLVDDKKSLIWEWIPGQAHPVKRPFTVSAGFDAMRCYLFSKSVVGSHLSRQQAGHIFLTSSEWPCVS